MEDVLITGIQVNYYFVCKRKLWLFSHNLNMENKNEAVQIGSILHNYFYKRQKKEIELPGIKIDFINKNFKIINEIKKSKAIELSHIWQLKYYIYYLKKKGINVKGELNYPLLKKKKKVELSNEDEIELEKILENIKLIIKSNIPSIEKKFFCKKCSYYELCYI